MNNEEMSKYLIKKLNIAHEKSTTYMDLEEDETNPESKKYWSNQFLMEMERVNVLEELLEDLGHDRKEIFKLRTKEILSKEV